MPNTILLKGRDARYDEGRVKAATTIKPGMLIERFTDGTWQPHATAGGTFTGGAVASEDALQGKTITDNYSGGDLIRLYIPLPGDEVQLILKAGENAAMNSKLSSNGDGTMQVVTGTEGVVFEALEALNLTGGGAVDTFIKARRL